MTQNDVPKPPYADNKKATNSFLYLKKLLDNPMIGALVMLMITLIISIFIGVVVVR
ncbi:hypothetical protein IPM62_00915 [Candidatus Woesebacteria bacterium]|nr:MAG: hypothetical protein IPM62_00915 [Candidatus Woesebacteria bacterium]